MRALLEAPVLRGPRHRSGRSAGCRGTRRAAGVSPALRPLFRPRARLRAAAHSRRDDLRGGHEHGVHHRARPASALSRGRHVRGLVVPDRAQRRARRSAEAGGRRASGRGGLDRAGRRGAVSRVRTCCATPHADPPAPTRSSNTCSHCASEPASPSTRSDRSSAPHQERCACACTGFSNGYDGGITMTTDQLKRDL
jgi:hypothetical protein